MKLKPYPEYKDSEVEWIKELPKKWDFRKIKTLSVVRRGASPRPIDDPKYFDDNEEYSWVRIADVTASSKYLYKTTETLSILGKSLSVPLEPGELFISIAGSVGKPIITKIKCCIHDGFVYFQDLKLNPEYLYYIFISGQAYQGLGKLGTQLNLNTETIGSIDIPFPSNEEQNDIVKFLDKKTSEIDLTIEKDTRLIELLKEKRTALINHVVTKGLDPTVKMKDSGVEWIGEIPEDWNIMKLKHVVTNKITDGPHETPELLDHGVPFISADAIKKDKIDFSRKRGFISENDHKKFSIKCKPQRDDVFLIKSGATTGNVAIVETDEKFSIWSPLSLIRADKTVILPRLLYYDLLSDYFKKLIEISWSYGTQQNIGMGVIENLSIIVPDIQEQNLLLNYLDKETSNIDLIIKKIQINIDLLNEYKKSLIHHVVTGKVDVREVAV